MSRRYEFLEDGMEMSPMGRASEDEREDMDPILVLGNPYAAAAVITGGWDGIEAYLTKALMFVRAARSDVEGWRAAVEEHLDSEDFEPQERERLFAEAMRKVEQPQP